MTDKKNIFNNLSFGSLILAKRLADTQAIEIGHKNGPFLVLERRNDYLVCLYATSKEKINSLIKISKNNYNLTKDTYITSNIRFISIDEFISPIYNLNEIEMKNLIKILYINGLENYVIFNEPSLEIGDIIQLKRQHLIIGETDDNYITIKIIYNKSTRCYECYYDQKNILPKNQKYNRIAFLSSEEISKCINESKKYVNLQNIGKLNKKVPNLVVSPLQVGNLIIYKKVLYYLYFELGNKKLSFSVSRNQTSISQEITINGVLYYANFGSKRDFFENESDVHLVDTATKEEKEQIKRKRCNKL